MGNDIYRLAQFNDGEGVEYDDFNISARVALARLTDQYLEHLAGAGHTTTDDPDLWGEQGPDVDMSNLIYTATGGDGVLKQGSTTTKIGTFGGTIFQKVGSADGAAPTFIPYTMVDNEFNLTIGAGHATLKRIDIVQVKLEWESGATESRDFKDATTGALTTTTPNKKRRVKATISLKAGTAGATPAYPSPDAGYAMLGAVFVPATWAANVSSEAWASVTTHAKIRQCSVPLRVRAYTIMGSQMDISQASGSPVVSNGCVFATAGDAANIIAWCPAGGPGTRLVGIALHGAFQSATGGNNSAVLKCYQAIDGGGSFNINASSTADSTLTSKLISAAVDTMKSRFAHLGDIAAGVSDSTPASAGLGDGFWVGGGRSGPAHQPIKHNAGVASGDDVWFSQLGLKLGIEDQSWIFAVTFYLAG
jgi:hypothetical protein